MKKYYIFAFLIGLIALVQEIIWIRALTFYSAGVAIIFGMVLGHYIYGLAIGALFSREFFKKRNTILFKALRSAFLFLLGTLGAGVIFYITASSYDISKLGYISSIPYIKASAYIIPWFTLPITIILMSVVFHFVKKVIGNKEGEAKKLIVILLLLSNIIMFISIPLLAHFATMPAFFNLTPSIGSSEIIATVGLYVLLTLTACFTGAVLPLLSGIASEKSEDIGSIVSKIFFSNIIGSTIGSLLAGFVLLNYFTLEKSILINSMLMIIVTISFVLTLKNINKRNTLISLITLSAIFFFSFDSLYTHNSIFEKLFFKTKYTGQKFIDSFQGKSGIINSVMGKSGKIEVIGHGVYDGFVNTDFSSNINNLDRLIYSFFLKNKVKKVLSIGLGSGSWAKVMSNYHPLEKLTIVEINEDYNKLIAKFEETSSLVTDPKVNIIIDDGRRWLKNNPNEKFDLIIMNLTFYWRNHASSLLSQDFLKEVKSHLEVDGVMSYNPTNSMANVITSMSLFDKIYIYDSFLYLTDSDWVASAEQKKIVISSFQENGTIMIDPNVKDQKKVFDKLTRTEVTSLKQKVKDLKLPLGVITDDNMYNEFHISADFFTIQNFFPSEINYHY